MKKKLNKKQLSLLISLMVLLTVSVGSTLAYIVTQTNPVANTFKPSEVTCDVIESFEGNVKSNVKIQNTGDVDAFIRAEVIVTWQDGKGNILATVPELGGDYTITYNNNDGWDTQTSDGYYYYTSVVPTGEEGITGELITECKKLKEAPETGYYLCVDVIADAIQAEPTSVVEDSWGVVYDAATKTISK